MPNKSEENRGLGGGAPESGGSRGSSPWASMTREPGKMLEEHQTRETRSRGDEGTRTPNPCLAKAVLCQLSYAPVLLRRPPVLCAAGDGPGRAVAWRRAFTSVRHAGRWCGGRKLRSRHGC